MKIALQVPSGEKLETLAGNMGRMAAAYRLRLAKRAQVLGAAPPSWGGKPISVDEEEKSLLGEDTRRIAPYPYPGLRSFDPGEGEFFFGHARNVEAVRDLLAKNRVVAVLGGSGSGKSSLLRAGLLPFLNTKRRIQGRYGNWYSTEFRPRRAPLHELAAALAEQLILPLLTTSKTACLSELAGKLGIPSDITLNSENAAAWLHRHFEERFVEANRNGRETVLGTFSDIAGRMLDEADNLVTGGRRLSEPSLFLLVDQLEEVFRPEVAPDQREALLNLIVDLHAAAKDRKGSVYLAVTMRSEELHRCAEHRGLSDVVIGSGYQLELLDPANPEDRADLRLAIIQPARNVFADWGLRGLLERKDGDASARDGNDDAPFSPGMPDLLLAAAGRLSEELEHRPDQLPLLQHALQATWHSAMKRWSHGVSCIEDLQITRHDLIGYHGDNEVPDLGECLNLRADDACAEVAQRFAASAAVAGATKETGDDALRATFRALARLDDTGNWARRFAGRSDIAVFLDADLNSGLAQIPDATRWSALQNALSSFVLRGYLNGGGTREYDISHEALIRNWRKFQSWLRDPREVAYCLGRVLREVEEPDNFSLLTDRAKVDLIPPIVAGRVAMVGAEGQLPFRWGEDQIAPILQNLPLRLRWGDTSSAALQRVISLGNMAERARERIQRRRFRREFIERRARQLVGGVALLALAALGGFLYWDIKTRAAAQKLADMRRITALARDALWSDGPATAIMVASQVRSVGLSESPEAERLLLTSLHQLREGRILAGGHAQMVNSVSYSPEGDALVSSDPESVLFSRAADGVAIDRIGLPYLEAKSESEPSRWTSTSRRFDGPILSAQWSPGGNWIAVASRDQTLLFAPCSREELRHWFVACEGHDDDVVQLLGDSANNRTGAAKFSADGHWMATGGFGTSIKLWDVAATPVRKQREFEGNISWPNAVAISPDGQIVAAGLGSTRSEITVLDSSSRKTVATLGVGDTQHGNFVAIAFNSKDPGMLAASTLDGNIFVWEDWRKNSLPSTKLESARGTAFQIAFSRDGGYLVSASDDGVVRMWTPGNGLPESRWREVGELRGHKGPVWTVAVHPDGNSIASGATDGSIILWNRRSAFHLDDSLGSPAVPSADTSSTLDPSACARDLKLPRDFDAPAACVRSSNGRIVVASSKGRLIVFDQTREAVVAVDDYWIPSDIASIGLAGDRLVVETRSGARSEWPFFDNLDALIDYALVRLPYDRIRRIALPKDLLCRIDDHAEGCDAHAMLSSVELP
jgi:WD40 repeat protein